MKFLILLLALAACSQTSHPQKKLDPLLTSFWEERSKLYPFDATSQGDNRYNDQFPNDTTAEFREKEVQFYTKYLNQLSKIDRSTLSHNDKVSYDMFKYNLDQALESMKFNQWMVPFQQFWGLHQSFGQMGSGAGIQPFKTVQDYKNWLSRMGGFDEWADGAIENFRAGIKANNVLPRSLVVKILPQLKSVYNVKVEKSLFYGPIDKFPAEFSASDKELLKGAYANAIKTVINPSYKKMHDFLKNEYLPKARKSDGISAIPNGREYYAFLVRLWTTTDKSPDEIYETGKKEVARLTQEMEKVKNQVGFKGNLKQFFTHLKTDKKLYPYKNPQEVLDLFRDIHKKMEPKLLTMFSRTPKAAFEIRQTEKFREESASAEYQPGTPDGSRPGIFYLPIPDAKKFNITSGTESLFLHEAIPGHHYQISLQQENQDLPQFRKFAWYGAMGEGWALYTESLGKELGLYTDPYHYFGALGDEMHRACRLVVDVGIHTKGMTREQAIKYLMDHEPISYDGAVAEIERYMAIPGQALSYKVGSLKIQELRKKYSDLLGAKFKLASFHDEVLKDGVMPLSTLEKKMDDWAKSEQD